MKKTLLATMILSAFGLTACGGGDSGSSSSSSSSTSTTALTISGVVNKGIVKDGAVTVCLATVANTANRSCDEDGILATGTTTEKGAFDLSDIDLAVDIPVMLVVKNNPDGDTQMKCDLAASCAGPDGTTTYAFGEWMPVADTYKRIAIITPTAETTTANITNLTHLAAEKAITSAGNADISAATVKAAQETIQNKLGITTSIQSLGSVDITEATDVASANSDDVTAALYSAALNTFFSDDGTDTDGSAATLITDTTTTDEETAVDTLMTTLKTSADTISTSVQAEIDASEDEDVKTAATSNLTTAETTVAAADPAAVESVTEADASETLTQDDVDRAKALIEQIRTVASAAQDGTIEGAFSDFSDEVTPIKDLMAADMAGLTDKLSQAIAAVVFAYDSTADATSSYQASTSDDKTFTVEADGVSLVATINSATVLETSSGDNTCDDMTYQDSVYSCSENDNGRVIADINITFDSLAITEGSTTLTLDGDETSQVLVTNFDSTWADSHSEDGSFIHTESDAATVDDVDQTVANYNDINTYDEDYSSSDSSRESTFADHIKVVLNGATLTHADSVGNNSFVGTISFDLVNPDFSYQESSEWTNTFDETWTKSGDFKVGTYSTYVDDQGNTVNDYYWITWGYWDDTTGMYVDNSYEEAADTSYSNSSSGNYTSAVTLTSFAVEIAGDITTSSGNTVGAQLNATISNSGGYTINTEEAWNYAYSYTDSYSYSYDAETSSGFEDDSWGDGTSTSSESDTESETLTNISGASESSSSYIAATVIAQVTSDITNSLGTDVATSVGLTVSRSSLTAADVTLDVGYNGASTVFKTTLDSTDTDGAIDITVTGSTDSTTIASLNVSETGVYSGKITVDGEQAANISEDNGIPYIYFYDGTEATEFQSLF